MEVQFMSIVVLGTVALDSIKTPAGLRKNLLGGSAAHFAMSANFFTKVHLAGVIGRDFPEQHIEFLKHRNINLDALTRQKGKTFKWQGEYKKEDLNTALTLNTELGVLASSFPVLSKQQLRMKNVFLANYAPDLQERFLKEIGSAQFVGLDTMNLWINTQVKSVKKLLKQVNIVIVNETEAKQLSGQNNLMAAAKFLYALGPQMVIIKKGEHGALFYSNTLTCILPAYPVENVVDPTGAGDTFAGGVMGYITKSRKLNASVLRRALGYGIIFSSFNVQDFGLKRTAVLETNDVRQRMAKFKELLRF